MVIKVTEKELRSRNLCNNLGSTGPGAGTGYGEPTKSRIRVRPGYANIIVLFCVISNIYRKHIRNCFLATNGKSRVKYI